MGAMIRAGVAAAAILALAAAAAAEEEDPWRLDISGPASVDQIVGERLSGLSGAAVKVGSTDLDQDGFPEFFVFAGGRGTLMRLGATGWTDISGGVLDGVAAPNAVTFREEWFNGFQVLRANGELQVFKAGAYGPRSAIAPEKLDTAAFLPACVASPALGAAERESAAEPPDPDAWCACLAEEWAARDTSQRLLDGWAQLIVDRSKVALNDDELMRIDVPISEVQQSCDLRFRLDQGLSKPETTPFDGSAMPDTAARFIDACAAQDYVVAHRRVRTPDRALGLCACMAAQMTVDGLDAEGFTLAASLYAGEMSEEDVRAVAADPVEKSDAAATECFRRLPTE